MGEYEDRYPEAYGRGDEPVQPVASEDRKAAPPRQVQERFALRSRFGLATAAEAPPTWDHAPSETARTIEPAAPPSRPRPLDYRGIGPRGYVRSPERIYQDICDRLTENPFIDASDITVSVTGSEVRLAGSVDSPIVARQVEVIARQVSGVSWVHNDLRLRPAGEAPATSARQRTDRVAPAGR